MCGIVGLYLKDRRMAEEIGDLFATMLVCMSDRGPDSAGFAVYGDEPPDGYVKVTLRHSGDTYDWQALSGRLGRRFACEARLKVNANYAVIAVRAAAGELRRAVAELDPGLTVMSIGRSIEIFKEIGAPAAIVERFAIRKLHGTHVIGHTRMATESAVTTDGSHPFSTGMDLCLVHNGSLSNHNRLRARLQRRGIEIRTENDSEVAAGYLMWRLQQGDSLAEALHASLDDLDGFYTFAIGTSGGFAVLRDPIACKPAVLAETADYVAMASEFQALAALPGIDAARVWEPKPAQVYTWDRAA
jgi:amidophosphoribosyltransferase